MTGNLDFDKRKRCVQRMVTPSGLVYDRIYYGLTEETAKGIFPSDWHMQDVRDNYKDLGRGGRKPSLGWEERPRPTKYFFTGKL